MSIYVDFHVIQTVPPSCVNRDDTGSPKTAVYGGVTRARVSSQAWKKAIRDMFCEEFPKEDIGLRTKKIVDLVAEKLKDYKPDLTEKEIQKATLIAQKLNLQFTNISALYAEAQQRKGKIEQREMEESINSEKNEEQKRYNELIKYANYSGREKRIAMLADMQKKYAEAAKTLRDGASAVWSASQLKEKEGDWATMGGIASAIAGPAAGMATALDSQAKTAQENAQIREQNRINHEAFAPVIAMSYKEAAQNERMAKSYAESLESAKTKLVANDSTEECFARLIFDGTTIDVSRTGTCTVMTSVCASPFKIFDDVPAVIDGTIIAQIYDNNKLIGKAKMVLPIYGIQGKKNKVKLTGMALFCGSAGTSYRIEFVPEKLWAMEQ